MLPACFSERCEQMLEAELWSQSWSSN